MEGYCSLILFATNKTNSIVDEIGLAYLIVGYPLIAVLSELIGYSNNIYSIIYRATLCVLFIFIFIKNKYKLNLNIVTLFLILILIFILFNNISTKQLLVYVSSVMLPVIVLTTRLSIKSQDLLLKILIIILWPIIIGIIFLAYSKNINISDILKNRFETLKLNSITISQCGCYFSVLSLILLIKTETYDYKKILYLSLINFIGLFVIYIGASRGSILMYILILIISIVYIYKFDINKILKIIYVLMPLFLLNAIILIFNFKSQLNERIARGIFNDEKRTELILNSITGNNIGASISINHAEGTVFNQNHPHNIIFQAFNFNFLFGLLLTYIIVLTLIEIIRNIKINKLLVPFLGIVFIIEAFLYGDILTTFGLFAISSILIQNRGKYY
jgi:hypothetical protein